jgi:histidyl-tRNA synthetase
MTTEKDKKSIYKPRPVTGFPEWLPEVRLVEQQWMDHIRRVFESYGFCSVETPSVEELDVLRAKGEVDKEIYVIERLHKDDNDKSDARLALHFDQTVPLARYVAQHFNDLVFPFKRYQMQRVWRGERPQAGRFREFYQCDIDVINVDQLPLHFDAEMPAIMWEVMNGLPGMENEKIQIRISNRKILIGLLEAHQIFDPEQQMLILRIIDKKEKLKKSEFEELLIKQIDAIASLFEAGSKESALKLKSKTLQFLDFADAIKRKSTAKEQEMALNEQIQTFESEINEFSKNSTYAVGIQELSLVLQSLHDLPPGAVIADLSIVRGLDYYTGTVYETVFIDDPTYGSICSGGRYEDLAGSYINKKLPGVGISIGFSRLFDRLRVQNKLPVSAKSPADILMVLPSEERRAETARTAQILRRNGIRVEMYHAAKKTGDQFKYASRKNIPFVWIPPFEDGQPHQVKNMLTGEQTEANAENWTIPRKENLHESAA